MAFSVDSKIIEMGGVGAQKGQEGGVLSLYGIGSCVGIILYDTLRKIGGVVHPMLPSSSIGSSCTLSPYTFVDKSITLLVKKLVEEFGADKNSLKVVLAGGANMQTANPFFRLGDQNIKAVREVLKIEGLSLVGEDTGGTHNRTVHLNIGSGQVAVSSPMHSWEMLLK